MADEDILNRPEDVKIRTMEGDLKGAPENLLKPETTVQLPPPEQPVGPAGKLFPEEGPAKKVKLWFWVGGAVLVVALGLVGYFVVYPLVFPPKAMAPVGEEKPIVKTEAPPLAGQAVPHKSFFANPTAATSKINFSQLNLLNIASELQAESLKSLASGSVRELEIADGQGNQIPLAFYLPEVVPAFENLKLAEWFEKDFTAYLYYDATGVWPGYVTKIKSDAKVDELKAALAQLESADFSAFYISSPGTFGKFKDGQVDSYATRYSVGSKLGASFNYGYFGDKLIISTSFNGLKAALELLGL